MCMCVRMQCGNGDTCGFELTKQIGTLIVTKAILDNILEHFVPYVFLSLFPSSKRQSPIRKT